MQYICMYNLTCMDGNAFMCFSSIVKALGGMKVK